jgi:2-polyprenyl-3-methyl-5-hydroxy-6-metoxy-1,4-benzoquinol methylase
VPVYEATVNASDDTSQGRMLDLIGGGKTVLDVGCATGYLARALVERGCQVSGVELVPEAAEKARPVLDRLVVGDLATLDLAAEFGEARFDCVVAGDVLEHLADPAPVLRSLVGLLAPGGSVVVSTPNVSHGSLRLALLQGRWQYLDRGLLDRTHLRFFTRASLLELLHDCGLSVVQMHPTTGDPLGVEVDVDVAALPEGIVDWVRAQPDATVYQWVLRAVVDDAAGRAESVAVEMEGLRRTTDELRAELVRTTAERDAARADLAVIRSTRSWRALEPLRRVAGRVRPGRQSPL